MKTTRFRFHLLSWLALAALPALSGCTVKETVLGPADLCEDLDCSGHGTCVATAEGEALCVCDPGYHSEGTDCRADQAGEKCSGVDCSGHGTCVVVNGDPDYPMCVCEDGYGLVGRTNCVEESAGGLECGPGTHEENGTCLPDEAVPSSCDAVNCGPNGTCRINQFGLAYCDCDDGYRSDNFSCVEDCTGSIEYLGSVQLPHLEGEYTGWQRGPKLFMRGDLVYASDMHGLAVVDISDPSSPQVLSDTFSPWAQERGFSILDIALGDDYVYQLAQWHSDDYQVLWGGVAVFDVSDPANPTVVGQVMSQIDADNRAMSVQRIALSGDRLFLGGMTVVTALDVADPTSPTVGEVLDVPQEIGQIPELYSVGRDWLWMSYLPPDPMSSSDMIPWGMVDVSDPRAMKPYWPMEEFTGFDGLGVAGSLGGVGTRGGRFMLVDLAQPQSPVFLGTMRLVEDVLYEARFFGHYAVLTTSGNLYVVDVGDPADPRVSAVVNPLENTGLVTGLRHGIAVRDDGTIAGYSGTTIATFRFRCE